MGRKFLVAGRGGLNLTHSEAREQFVGRYEDELPRWQSLLSKFGPDDLRAWAAALGVETYVGSSRRVFPRGQQAAVLLRRWVARLRTLGVAFHVNHRLQMLEPHAAGGWDLSLRHLRTGEEQRPLFRAVILALGGASWPETGSDGTWPDLLRPLGLPVTAWQPANVGFGVDWEPQLLAAAEGLPLKNIVVSVGDRSVPGELLITKYGLEGGALYQLGRFLRSTPTPILTVDFKPGVSTEQLQARTPVGYRQAVPWTELVRAWKLSPATEAIFRYHGPGDDQPVETLATWAKRFPLKLLSPRPVEEAISSAGGLKWSALNDGLMCQNLPGLFVAGEMLDWEAPTGGYLLQGCFATGTRAGRSAASFLHSITTPS